MELADVISMNDEFVGTPAPTVLVERPLVRWFWIVGWSTFGLAIFLMMVWPGLVPPEDRGAEVWVGLGFAVLSMSLGLAALRWAIVADEHAVRVTNYFRTRTIPWSDLDDIELHAVQAQISVGFYRIVFVTHGRRIPAAAPTGRPNPGRKLFELGQALIAMRHRYSAAP